MTEIEIRNVCCVTEIGITLCTTPQLQKTLRVFVSLKSLCLSAAGIRSFATVASLGTPLVFIVVP